MLPTIDMRLFRDRSMLIHRTPNLFFCLTRFLKRIAQTSKCSVRAKRAKHGVYKIILLHARPILFESYFAMMIEINQLGKISTHNTRGFREPRRGYWTDVSYTVLRLITGGHQIWRVLVFTTIFREHCVSCDTRTRYTWYVIMPKGVNICVKNAQC